MPLIDMQKSSNTVALVESFLGEFKPDEEETPSESPNDKSNIKTTAENRFEKSQTSKKRTLKYISKMSKTLENKVSSKIKANQLNYVDNITENKYNDAPKEIIEKRVVHKNQSLPPKSQPSPPVKRKVIYFYDMFLNI